MSEGNFHCNWCGNMKPISERVQDVDDSGFVTWIGCIKCHKRRG